MTDDQQNTDPRSEMEAWLNSRGIFCDPYRTPFNRGERPACPKCGKPMTTFRVLKSVQGHCTNPECILHMITLDIGAHEQLTEAQIQQYVEARQAGSERNHAERVLELMQLFGEAGDHGNE